MSAPPAEGAALACFLGSPFARMARAPIREWALPVAEVEQEFPPAPDLFLWSPLGQVPALSVDGRRFFPTLPVLERLWSLAAEPGAAYRPAEERQTLLTALQAGDALVAGLYQGWAGLRRVAEDQVGLDPAARNPERAGVVFDWLDGMAEAGALRPGVTLPGVAAACVALWSGARGGPDLSRPALAPIIAGLAGRASFRATAPQAWAPS